MATVWPTTEVGWDELLAHPDVSETVKLRGSFGLMAFHGGVEEGTAEIARLAAEAASASLYTVDQPDELRWHVPSSLVDPARQGCLTAFLTHACDVVALHGYGRSGPGDPVLVGGSGRVLGRRVAVALRSALPGTDVIDDIDDIPAGLRGLHPDNPVNRVSGSGVQLELPLLVRRRQGEAVAAALGEVARTWWTAA